MQYTVVDLGDMEYCDLIPIADLHIGDPLFHEKKFKGLRDWIAKKPNARVVLVGDLLNCATKNSKSDIYGERMNPGEAVKYAYEILEPIRDKILGSVWGNHCRRVYRESGIDISETLADKLGVPYGREGMLYNIKFDRYPDLRKGKINYTVYTNHGNGGGSSPGSKANVVHKLSHMVFADIFISAHVHRSSGDKDTILVPDTRNNKMDFKTMTYASAGSFLAWGGYAEDGCYPPAKLGTSKIHMNGTRKNCHVSI